MEEQTTPQQHEIHPRDFQKKEAAHPLIKWIVALIIGLVGSLLLMTFLVAQLISESGGIGGDLVFENFFIYTGGFILIENMGGSIFMFVLTTVYYFLFFMLIGLIIGYIIELLTKFIRYN